MTIQDCAECGQAAGTLHYQHANHLFVCRHCYDRPPDADTCRAFEYGHENPIDPKGSTAHVRDIKLRRIDPKTKEVFNYKSPSKYFY